MPTAEGGPAWVREAFRVHTTRSDGRGSVEEVARVGRAAGLRFVVLTDHNDHELREPECERCVHSVHWAHWGGRAGGERREARVGEVLTVRLPQHPEGQVRVEVWGAGRLREDGRSVELVEPGAVQVEAWVRAPGRFFGSEWRPWLVPSPVRVVPAGRGPSREQGLEGATTGR